MQRRVATLTHLRSFTVKFYAPQLRSRSFCHTRLFQNSNTLLPRHMCFALPRQVFPGRCHFSEHGFLIGLLGLPYDANPGPDGIFGKDTYRSALPQDEKMTVGIGLWQRFSTSQTL
jgi:hypothetical protein